MAKITLITCKTANYEGDGASRHVIWDDEIKGFGLRVYPSGQKAFILSYRLAGKKRLFTIGDFGVWTPDQARREARKLLVDIEHGIDPNTARAAAKQQGVTFGQLKDMYLSKHAILKKSGDEDAAILRRYIPNSWAGRLLQEFNRLEMSKLHHSIGEGKGPYAANRLIACLRKMFNVGVQEGLLPEGHPNPAIPGLGRKDSSSGGKVGNLVKCLCANRFSRHDFALWMSKSTCPRLMPLEK